MSEGHRPDKESISDPNPLVIEGGSIRGRGHQSSPQNRDMFGTRSKSRGRPTCFYCGKLEHFQKNFQHYRKDKGGVDCAEPKKNPERKGTSTISTSEEELLLISEQNELNLVGDESTWVVDSGASFHLAPCKDVMCKSYN